MRDIDFKVGDLVRIRDWDDMEAEFGLKDNRVMPVIACAYTFSSAMRYLCGEEFTIEGLSKFNGRTKVLGCRVAEPFYISTDMIEHVDQETIVYTQEELYSFLFTPWEGVVMGKRKHRYYAVKVGKEPGIYESWDECRKQVEGFSGAQYKGFSSKKEATQYMSGGSNQPGEEPDKPEVLTVYVDGSYDPYSGVYGYGFIAIHPDGEKSVFKNAADHKDPARLRNVAGEMIGAMSAVKYAIQCGYKAVDIYYDYFGIEFWVTGTWKTKSVFTYQYADFMREKGDEILISFHKVTAHTNVEYNEIADQLAKEAVLNFNGKSI